MNDTDPISSMGFSTPLSKDLSKRLGIEEGRGGIFFDEDPRQVRSEARERRKQLLRERTREQKRAEQESMRKRRHLFISACVCGILTLGIFVYLVLVDMDTSSRVGWIGLCLALTQTAIALLQSRANVGRDRVARAFLETQFAIVNQSIAQNEVLLSKGSFLSEMALENTEELVSLAELSDLAKTRLRLRKAPGAISRADFELESDIKLIELGAFDDQLRDEIHREAAMDLKRRNDPFFV